MTLISKNGSGLMMLEHKQHNNYKELFLKYDNMKDNQNP